VKRPAFQFYPADWRKDPELGSCRYVARGIWWEMLCIMHECRPYGHLSRNGAPIPEASVSELIKVPLPAYRKAVEELEANGVFSRLADGTIYSRRMVRDEHIREVRAAAGKQGGNPLLVGNKDKQNASNGSDLLNHAPNLGLTPSSSSSASALSSSSASANAKPKSTSGGNGAEHHAVRATRLPPDWRLPEDWKAWAVQVHHLEPDRVVRISLTFRDYWIAKAKDAAKVDWLATWRNWIRKECANA